VDIVLPLLAADVDRYLRLQRPTFERFYGDLGTTWIYARPEEVDTVTSATAGLAGVHVLSDLELVPELALMRATRGDVTRGWYQQQVIKLAALAGLDAPFALVLDADVIAVRDVGDDDLLRDGRAIRAREPVAEHPGWVRQSADALGVAPLDYSAKVQPSVLAPAAVRLLAGYAERSVRARKSIARAASMTPGLRRRLTTWRGRLIAALPWTENQLYDTFLVRTGQFEQFHVVVDDPVLYDNCVWHRGQFEAWAPGPVADGPTFYFSVVQAALKIPVGDISARLRGAGVLGATS
jgi:hypothetical protein